MPSVKAPAFVPSFTLKVPVQEEDPQLEFKQKAKTELCKFWMTTRKCKYGESCAFAHGEHELQKKTHVASKYRMTHCSAYAQGSCFYG